MTVTVTVTVTGKGVPCCLAEQGAKYVQGTAGGQGPRQALQGGGSSRVGVGAQAVIRVQAGVRVQIGYMCVGLPGARVRGQLRLLR